MSIGQILDILCEALEIQPGSLNDDTVIAQVDVWDSIGWMNVLAVADRRFNVQIMPTSTNEFRTAGDVARHILSKV